MHQQKRQQQEGDDSHGLLVGAKAPAAAGVREAAAVLAQLGVFSGKKRTHHEGA
jgi:hypothetical protein